MFVNRAFRVASRCKQGLKNTQSAALFRPVGALCVAFGVMGSSFVAMSEKEKEKEAKDGSASSPQIAPVGETSQRVLAQIEQVDNKHFRFIIVGAGVAGMSALEELVRKEPDANILIVNAENSMPYVRYPLSKELWLGSNEMVRNISRAVQMLSEDDFRAQYPNVTYLRGCLATNLDPEAQHLDFEGHGRKFSASYDQCLLATGARPRRPACIGQGETFGGRVIKFREVSDYERLQEYASTGQDIVVVGGGFLGTELANAINLQSKQAGANIEPRAGKKQRQVTHVIPEPGVLYRFLPLYLADYTANRMSSHGVDMRTNSIITGIQWVPPSDKERREDASHMVSEAGGVGDHKPTSEKGHMLVEMTIRTLGNMRRGPGSAIHNKFLDVRKYTIKADCVVYCVGVDPNSEISKLAGLEVDKDKAIIADSTLRVVNNVYAAGDNVSYHDKILGRRRMEHHDHAEATGKHAARNMCAKPGTQTDFGHLSEFWSDLMDLGVHFEGVGNIQNHYRTVGYWNLNRTQFVSPVQDVPDYEACEYKKGLVYYLDEDNRVVGVLTWNIKGQLHNARELIKKKLKYDDPVFELRNALDIRDQHGLKATMCT